MRNHVGLLFVSAFLFCPVCLQAVSGTPPVYAEREWKQFEAKCLDLRKVEESMRAAKASEYEKQVQLVLQNTKDRFALDELGGEVFVLHRAYLCARGGSEMRARNLLLDLVDRPGVSAESLSALADIARTDGRTSDVVFLEMQLAQVLPLSGFSVIHNAAWRGGDGRWPVIPVVDKDGMIRVAQKLRLMGLLDVAGSAYREAIYATYSPEYPISGYGISGKWLSSESGDLWLKVADCDFRRGEEMGAASALAKVIIFGGESQTLAARAMIGKYMAGQVSRHQEVVRPDKKDIQEVAEIYAGMNFHPRAVAWISSVASSHDVIWRQRIERDYTRRWTLVLDQTPTGEGTLTLFGRGFTSKADAVKARVPFSCSRENLGSISLSVRSRFPNGKE